MSYTDKMLRDDALKGKVIVVTGGGSGLGKAMTKYFLELGAQVAITSRDIEKLKNTAAELETETGIALHRLYCAEYAREQPPDANEKNCCGDAKTYPIDEPGGHGCAAGARQLRERRRPAHTPPHRHYGEQ